MPSDLYLIHCRGLPVSCLYVWFFLFLNLALSKVSIENINFSSSLSNGIKFLASNFNLFSFLQTIWVIFSSLWFGQKQKSTILTACGFTRGDKWLSVTRTLSQARIPYTSAEIRSLLGQSAWTVRSPRISFLAPAAQLTWAQHSASRSRKEIRGWSIRGDGSLHLLSSSKLVLLL